MIPDYQLAALIAAYVNRENSYVMFSTTADEVYEWIKKNNEEK